MAVNLVSIAPITGAIGVPLNNSVQIVLSTSIDFTTIGIGSFFIEGSDKETLSGPYVPINFQGPSANAPFQDPAYFGIVQGQYVSEFYSTDGITPLATSFIDTSGTEAYYTKITLQPLRPFSPLHPYKVYLVGTSTSGETIGIASRSVFDVMPNGLNTGNGVILPHGGYKGSINGTFAIEITSTGVVGNAQYKWKFNSLPFQPVAVSHTYRRQLQDGVSVAFGPEGTFQIGDEYKFLVKPKTFLAGVQISNFVTGDFGTQVLPNGTSSLVSRAAPPFPNLLEPGFALDHTVPINLECDIDVNTPYYTFYFNKALSTSFDTNGMKIYIGPVNGDTCIVSETSYNPNHVEIVNGTGLRIHIQNT